MRRRGATCAPPPPAAVVALLVLLAAGSVCGRDPARLHRQHHHAALRLLRAYGAADAPARQQATGTVAVAQPGVAPQTPTALPVMSLSAALRDPAVHTMVLVTNYSVVPEFDAYVNEQAPLRMTRNVTLTGTPGSPMPVLDFSFQRSGVHLCDACVFNMSGVAVANERRGIGAAVDFFAGNGSGAVLVLQDAYRLRPACTTTDSTIELIVREQKRSARFPSSGPHGRMQQLLRRKDVTYQCVAYPGMVWLVDYSYDVPSTFQEGKGMVGGYNMRTINTTRLCSHTVSQACLRVKPAEVCLNELIDNLTAAQHHTDAAGSQAAPGSGRVPIAAIVVPLAVVLGVLLPLLLGAVLWHRRRRRRQREQLLSPGGSKRDRRSLDRQSRAGGASDGSSSGSHLQPDADDGGDPFVCASELAPRVDQGWEVVATATKPSLGHVGSSKIYCGPLLGAGSFGRVYKGRWAGREVAVKAIEHDSETAAAVQTEVQLMMSFEHRNIVQALHYITFRHTVSVGDTGSSAGKLSNGAAHQRQQQAASAAAAGSGAGCTGGSPQSRAAREGRRTMQQLQRALELQLGPQQRRQLDRHLGFNPTPLAAAGGGGGASCSSCSGAAVCAPPCGELAGGPCLQMQPSCAAPAVGGSAVACGPGGSSGCAPPCGEEAADSGTSVAGVRTPVVVAAPRPLAAGSSGSSSAALSGVASPAQLWSADSSVQQAQQPGDGRHASLHATPPDQQQQHEQDRDHHHSHAQPPPPQPPPFDTQLQVPAQQLTPTQRARLGRFMLQQQRLLLQHTGGGRPKMVATLPPLPAGAAAVEGDGRMDGDAGGDTGKRRSGDGQRSRTFIVQEYCDHGTLTAYAATAVKDPCEERQLLQLLVLLQDAARGLVALHSKNVVHGDVNARNVLVSSCDDAPGGVVAKLADLGMSRVLRQHATHKTTNTVGTLSHMPPELLRHGRISPAVDIYSFGIMMWECWTGQPAFRHLHYGQFFECIVLKNMRPTVPEDMPRDYSLLMLSCWATSPRQRPSAEQVFDWLCLILQERQDGGGGGAYGSGYGSDDGSDDGSDGSDRSGSGSSGIGSSGSDGEQQGVGDAPKVPAATAAAAAAAPAAAPVAAAAAPAAAAPAAAAPVAAAAAPAAAAPAAAAPAAAAAAAAGGAAADAAATAGAC